MPHAPTEPEVYEPDGPTSIRQRAAPTVLVVGCSREFGARCREALEMSGAALEECSVHAYKDEATRLWPPVIVMTEELYAFDPEGLSEIPLALGCTLLRVASEDITVDALSSLLMPALFKAMPKQERAER